MRGHKWGSVKRAAIVFGSLLATAIAAGAHYRL